MLEKGFIETSLVPGPVDYAVLRPGSGPTTELPILLWLHGGGGSSRFLETCKAHFITGWQESSLPDLVAVTPSAGWSFYLDRFDGTELWETFLLEELVPHIRKQTGSSDGPLLIGGISSGAVAGLRLAFKRPELFAAVLAVEPTLEGALDVNQVLLRDRVHMPDTIRARLFGDPIDPRYWMANQPTALAAENATAIVANDVAVYLDCGDNDSLHAQYGAEQLHRQLFDAGISHEYRLVKGANHVGPTVGPRIVDALRFAGRILKADYEAPLSFDSLVEMETFANQVRELEMAVGYRQERTVQRLDCKLRVQVQGEGPRVVMLPSLGRGAADYADLADRVARAGFCMVRPEPRGVSGTSKSLEGVSLEHFADDVAAVIDSFGGPATVVGHDFGGQVAQMVSYLYPNLVSSLILLAPPGPKPAKPEPATALRRIFVPELSDEEHLEAVALALFAEGNDPVVWVNGWYPTLAFAQAEAERHISPEDIWARLRCDTLVLQPADDLIVVPENAKLMAEQLGDLVTSITIPNAGHALLPEQPEAVAAAVLSWLKTRG
ncbi:MAG: alpha/beta fold hydrolase [Actinomycetia bacterium]|nr:alpha/beta fold hydrolase [Actinomycetes bacterium]MCP4221755.1 alpha/beta fold hydrolase [Actinomycetes bacterium]MCP5030624.1 alpha/beta fold hydrolase [Actinomycetes bacterium]